MKTAPQQGYLMSTTINQSKNILQGQSEEVERFALFKFKHSLGKGIKNNIRSQGCFWNSLHKGWLCPIFKQNEVQVLLDNAKIGYEAREVSISKNLIQTDLRLANRQSRLDILVETTYQQERQLLEDVYLYDKSMRPEDFAVPLFEEGKSEVKLRFERDFHDRWNMIQKQKNEIEQLENEIERSTNEPGEKILDHEAPLSIAENLVHERFLNEGFRTLQYCSDAFWHWDGVQYVEYKTGEIRQATYAFLRNAKKISGPGNLKNFNPNKYKVDQVIDALKSICFHKHHPASGAAWLDGRDGPDPKFLISFRNGILCFDDWLKEPSTSLISHTPLLMNVNSLSFEYDPKASQPTTWIQFLNDIFQNDQESISLLQEWIGYLLTQDTRQHKILLMVGPPRSGKGTIGRILRELLGYHNVAGPTLSSLAGEFGLQPLLNQSLALISDARIGGKSGNSTIVERLLSISGEDPLTINRKHLPSLTVQLPTRIMMMSNELPDMRDSSGALTNRFLVLTLKKSWLGKEDPALFNRLRCELSGILLWALQGLTRLGERRYFIQPTSSTQTIEELEAMSSPIRAFVLEKCELNSYVVVPVTELFNSWRDWCSTTGYSHPGNIQSFGKNLRAAFPLIEVKRPQEDLIRERYYQGICIK